MRARTLRLAWLVCLGCDVAPAAEETIDEILVTATRRTADKAELSPGITLIGGESVRDLKLVTDSLDMRAGVFLQQTTPGQGAAIIRGLKGSAVLHLVDGLRLNNAIFRSAPTQYFALVPTSAVERIEVLRGTPASLYGSDAVGGVVQLVTRVPRFESPATEYRGELFAAYDSAELGRMLRGTVDAGHRELATSFSAEYLETGDRRTGGGERIGPSGFESRAARWLVTGRPADAHSWLFDLHWLEQPGTPRVDELVPGFGRTTPSSSEFLYAPNRRLFAHGRYVREAGARGLDWNIDIAWQRVDDDRSSRDFEATERSRENNRSDLYGLVVSGSRTGDHGSWIAGVETWIDTVSSARSSKSLIDGRVSARTPRFPDGSAIRRVAIFGNADRHLLRRNKLGGGLRVSHEDVSLAATPASPAASIRVTDVSGDVGWVFDATDVWQLVANAGFGFRAPNIFDLGTLGDRPGNRFNIPNPALGSERVVQLDAGIRYRGVRAQLEFMAYQLDYTDRITSVFTGGVTADGRDVVQSVNAAESKIRGFEAGANLALTDRITANAVLNYTWGEDRVSGLPAEPADRIPPLSGSFGMAWGGGDWRIEGWLRFADAQDRLSQRDVADTRIDPNGTSGWGMLGARATWDCARDWQLALTADNVLDKRYRLHGSGLDAPGRGFALSLRYRW